MYILRRKKRKFLVQYIAKVFKTTILEEKELLVRGHVAG